MSTLHEQIQTLLNQENIQEALTLFAESGRIEAALMQGQYDTLMEAKSLDKVDPSEWNRTISRIRYALLEMTKPETEAPKSTDDIRAQVQGLVANGKTEEALKLLVSTEHSGAEALLKRYNAAFTLYATNDIDFSRWSSIQANINFEILNGKNESEENVRSFSVPLKPADPGQKILPNEAAPQIRKALSQGNIEDAVRLFFSVGTMDGALLDKRFSSLKTQSSMGLIDAEELARAQAQICHAILETDCMKESEPSPQKPPKEVKSQILQLLDERKIEQALAICTDFGDHYLLTQAQFEASKIMFEQGMMTASQFEKSKSHVNYALREMLK